MSENYCNGPWPKYKAADGGNYVREITPDERITELEQELQAAREYAAKVVEWGNEADEVSRQRVTELEQQLDAIGRKRLDENGEIVSLKQQLAKAGEALRKYGWHTPGCPRFDDRMPKAPHAVTLCTCGWWDVIARAALSSPAEPGSEERKS